MHFTPRCAISGIKKWYFEKKIRAGHLRSLSLQRKQHRKAGGGGNKASHYAIGMFHDLSAHFSSMSPSLSMHCPDQHWPRKRMTHIPQCPSASPLTLIAELKADAGASCGSACNPYNNQCSLCPGSPGPACAARGLLVAYGLGHGARAEG